MVCGISRMCATVEVEFNERKCELMFVEAVCLAEKTKSSYDACPLWELKYFSVFH